MLSLAIGAFVAGIMVLGLLFKENRNVKNLFNIIGFVVLVIVAFIMMLIGKTVITMM